MFFNVIVIICHRLTNLVNMMKPSYIEVAFRCENCSNFWSWSKVTDLAWHPEESGLLAVGSDDRSLNQHSLKSNEVIQEKIALFIYLVLSFSNLTKCLHIWDLKSDDRLILPETDSTSKYRGWLSKRGDSQKNYNPTNILTQANCAGAGIIWQLPVKGRQRFSQQEDDSLLNWCLVNNDSIWSVLDVPETRMTKT